MLTPEEIQKLKHRNNAVPDLKSSEFSSDGAVSDFDLDKLRRTVGKLYPYLLALVIFSVVAAWLYLRYTPPIFEASSILKLDVKRESNVLGLGTADAFSDPGANMAGELELIQSNVILDQLVQMPIFKISHYYKGKILFEERYKNSPIQLEVLYLNPMLMDKEIHLDIERETASKLYYTLENKEYSLVINISDTFYTEHIQGIIHPTSFFESGQIPGSYFLKVHSDFSLFNYFSTNLKASIINPNARTIKISFKDFNRHKAQDIVNLIDTVYLKETLEDKNKAATQTITFLDNQLTVTDDSLSVAEERIQEFASLNKGIRVSSGVDRMLDQISELESRKYLLMNEYKAISKLSELVEKDSTENSAFTDFIFLENNVLYKMAEEYNSYRLRLRRMLVSNNENTLAVKSMRARLNDLKKRLEGVVANELKRKQIEIQNISDRIASIEREMKTFPQNEADYVRLKRYRDLYEKFYLLMMDKKAQYGINMAGTIPEFKVLAPAYTSEDPVFPRKWFVYSISFGSSLILSFLIIALGYIINNKISGQSEVELLIRAPFLGSIPRYKRNKLQYSQLVVMDNPKSQISEAFRSIRTNLEFIFPKKLGRVISITSTLSGEGKTFTAINLGGILAIAGQKVVLLDLDMRKPKLHLAFKASSMIGMSTLLIGKSKLKECLNQSSNENLFYITAGPVPPNPAELMLNDKLDKVLNELSKKFDTIIIDTPPVGIVADAVTLMSKADIPIYVLRSGVSKRSFCANVNKLRQNLGFKNLSVVLNDIDQSSAYGYGSVAAYGYGYYDEDTREK